MTIKAGKDSSTSYVKTINHSSQFLVRPGGSIREESFIENTTILSKNKTELPVSLIKEDIHIGNFSTMIKSYIITNESLFEQCDNSLPFAHKFDDESYSIVHQLYNNKIISHLAFALGKYQRYEGNFYFGKFHLMKLNLYINQNVMLTLVMLTGAVHCNMLTLVMRKVKFM